MKIFALETASADAQDIALALKNDPVVMTLDGRVIGLMFEPAMVPTSGRDADPEAVKQAHERAIESYGETFKALSKLG